MLRLYAAIHREMEDSLLPECTQEKEEATPRNKRRKRNSDPDDGSSISKREATEKCRPLPVYQKPRSVVRNNFFDPLRAVPLVGAEVCGETPSSDNNLDKGRPLPIVKISVVNLLSLQKDLKAVPTGEFFCNTASGTRITTKVWQKTKSHRTFQVRKVSHSSLYTPKETNW
jgi:hypothetical protein